MTRSNRRVTAAAVALTCCGIAGIAAATAAAPGGQAAPTSDPESTLSGPTTTGIPAFVDGEDARLAAEELIPAYIESEFGASVTDAACSVPERGDVGDEFACYALKPDELVIALRATIAARRLIELDLIYNQPPPTTTEPDSETTPE
jgi:hypothetical protein